MGSFHSRETQNRRCREKIVIELSNVTEAAVTSTMLALSQAEWLKNETLRLFAEKQEEFQKRIAGVQQSQQLDFDQERFNGKARKR